MGNPKINPEILEIIKRTARETAEAIWNAPVGESPFREWTGSRPLRDYCAGCGHLAGSKECARAHEKAKEEVERLRRELADQIEVASDASKCVQQVMEERDSLRLALDAEKANHRRNNEHLVAERDEARRERDEAVDDAKLHLRERRQMCRDRDLAEAERDRLKREYDEEVEEFNAGFDAARSGKPITDEPNESDYDVWRNGYMAGAYDRLEEEVGRLREVVDEMLMLLEWAAGGQLTIGKAEKLPPWIEKAREIRRPK